MKKRNSFTLAEVLITLTIIGVIAALTIPNLYSKYQKHTYAVGLKKAYTTLQNALKMSIITENCPSGDYECAGFFDANDKDDKSFNGNLALKRLYLLSKNIKYQKICLETSKSQSCGWDKTFQYGSGVRGGTILTQDGMLFGGVNYSGWDIHVDVNGFKGPNRAGLDRYMFSFYKDENTNYIMLLPIGSPLIDNKHRWEITCAESYKLISREASRYYCTARVLAEDAINYDWAAATE